MSKVYALGDRQSAREAVVSAARRMVRLERARHNEVWSLRDVTFSVKDGEAVGIVGRNGAGKSTALKILAGITSPTSGVARTRGRVAALLEVGTGFHSELTGRENVYLNGAILGMSRREIARSFDSIVEFSGVERFLDTPVKRYSSGMQLRLAFAVAAHLEPDVLVVDEILAVGDAEFQRKSLGRMEEAGREGRTVIFVSHDLDSLSAICPRSLWLEAGRIRGEGPSREIIRDYLASGLASAHTGAALIRVGALTVLDVRVTAHERASAVLMQEEELRVEVDFELAEEIPGLDCAVNLTTSTGVRVLDQALSDSGQRRLPKGRYRVQLVVPPILNVGTYAVGVYFGTQLSDLVDEPGVVSFTLHGSDHGRPGRVLISNFPMAVHPLTA